MGDQIAQVGIAHVTIRRYLRIPPGGDAVITCHKCAKENQDHYKFCLGCGSELPRDVSPKPFSPQTPPHGIKAVSHPPRGFETAATDPPPQFIPRPEAVAIATSEPPATMPAKHPSVAPPAGAGASGNVTCPQCSHQNTLTNLFCGACGYRLQGVSAPRQPAAKTSIASPQDMLPALATVSLTALRADGSDAGTFQVSSAETSIGRDSGVIFSGDSYLSPHHATLRIHADGRAVINDESSLNGVYRKLERDVPVELRDGTTFRIGQEIVRFETLKTEPPSSDGVERFGSPRRDAIGRLVLVIGRDQVGNAFLVPASGMHLGRERGEVLFPEDGYVSGLHCRINVEDGNVSLTDLGSSNGTFVRIAEDLELHTGDVLLMGQQLFRIAVSA